MWTAVIGLGFIAFRLTLAVLIWRHLSRSDKSTRPAWQFLARPSSVWAGLLLLATLLPSAIRGWTMFLILSWMIGFPVYQVIKHGPSALRRVRRIGDPDAWRGLPPTP